MDHYEDIERWTCLISDFDENELNCQEFIVNLEILDDWMVLVGFHSTHFYQLNLKLYVTYDELFKRAEDVLQYFKAIQNHKIVEALVGQEIVD